MEGNQFDDILVFGDKSLSNIFEDIYTNQQNKSKQIKELISELTPLIEGLGDATLLVPLIKEYLDISVKNDEQLVKLAQIVQRVNTGAAKASAGSDFFDFDSLQNLVAEDKNIKEEVQATQDKANAAVTPAS